MNKYRKFKGYLAEHSISYKELASVLGHSQMKITNILSKKSNQDFSLTDIITIANHYGLSDTEMMEMFVDRERHEEESFILA